MRCQSCDKNEATTAVVCDSCMAYYASIREGQFLAREVPLGEFQLRITSWIAIAAPASKKAAREEKAPGKKRKFFGGKAEPLPEPEPVPPPDWKNRVFPSPDAPQADALTEAEVQAAAVADAAVPESVVAAFEAPEVVDEPAVFSMGPESFSYDLAPASHEPELDHDDEQEKAPLVLDLAPAAAEAPAYMAPVLTDFLAGLALPDAEPVAAFEAAAVVEPIAPPHVATPEAAPEEIAPPAVDFSNFLDSLAALPETSASTAEQAPEEAPMSGLASFFETLTGAPAGPVAVHPEPEAEPQTTVAELSDFFATLAAAPTAEVEATTAPATPETPDAVGDLASFFEALALPGASVEASAAADPAPMVPTEEPTEATPTLTGFGPAIINMDETDLYETLTQEALAAVAEAEALTVEAPAPALDSDSDSDSETVHEFGNAAPDLASFFASLAPVEPETPEETVHEIAPPVETPASSHAGDLSSFFDTLKTPDPVVAAPPEVTPAVPLVDLTGFFESLSKPPAEPVRAPKPAPDLADAVMEAVSDGPVGDPLAFDVVMESPQAARPTPAAWSGADSRPPTVGSPFSIEIVAPSAAAPQTHAKRHTEELKRAHSQGELSFVGDDDESEQVTGFGLLDGLAYDKSHPHGPTNNSNAAARGAFHDDDEDDTKTLEL